MPSHSAKTISGRLAYFREDGSEWGREPFSMTRHEHARTYRSCMEMDDYGIHRDANWSMSLDWRPLEGFSRETENGETVAYSWYRIDDSNAEFETYARDGGRSSQKISAPGPIAHLGVHVILSDCMVAAARGCTDEGVEKPIICLANSLDGYGRGVSKALIVQPLVTYIGSEPIEVPAGTFTGEHFMVRWSDTVPRPSHFWVLGENFLPLRLEGASGPVTYELAELRHG